MGTASWLSRRCLCPGFSGYQKAEPQLWLTHANNSWHGIAATDAVCGLSLGKWSRGQDHSQAADLLSEVPLRDNTLPTKLRRLLADKDAAHYSPNLITVDEAKSMVRQAAALLVEADAR